MWNCGPIWNTNTTPLKTRRPTALKVWKNSLDLYSQQSFKNVIRYISSHTILAPIQVQWNPTSSHVHPIPDSTIIRNPKSFAHLILAVSVFTRPSGAALLRLPDAGGIGEAAKSQHSGYSESPMVPTSAGSHFYSERRGDGGWWA